MIDSQHRADIRRTVVSTAAPQPAPAKVVRRTKKDQLITLLSKPNGARASLIVERLGWQAHTVRAALSGLRKDGHPIVVSKSSKTGETVYTIAAQSHAPAIASDEAGA